jgi:hypothetical protein
MEPHRRIDACEAVFGHVAVGARAPFLRRQTPVVEEEPAQLDLLDGHRIVGRNGNRRQTERWSDRIRRGALAWHARSDRRDRQHRYVDPRRHVQTISTGMIGTALFAY